VIGAITGVAQEMGLDKQQVKYLFFTGNLQANLSEEIAQ
jgi:hypothetical protein